MTPIQEFVSTLKTKRRGTIYILDGISHDFYIRFDCTYEQEIKDSDKTCDILIVSIPDEYKINFISNATPCQILSFLELIKCL